MNLKQNGPADIGQGQTSECDTLDEVQCQGEAGFINGVIGERDEQALVRSLRRAILLEDGKKEKQVLPSVEAGKGEEMGYEMGKGKGGGGEGMEGVVQGGDVNWVVSRTEGCGEGAMKERESGCGDEF